MLRRLLRYLFVCLLTYSLASTDPVTTRRTIVIIQGGPYLQVAQRAQPKVCSVLWGYMYVCLMPRAGMETWTKQKKHLCFLVLDIVLPLMFWLVPSVTCCITC